jgi:hypothetical protein
MGLTRRDFFTLGIGAAVAVPLTPAPWRILDDTAKWSQNWSWIPRPSRGPLSVRYTTCTLCPAGCGMQVRCAGRNLIGIAPVAGHPVSKGVLCPYAFGAHQLPFHTARITQPLRKGQPDTIDRVTAEIAARVKSGATAILDERPGRAVSAAYQKMATYVIAPSSESATLRCFANAAGVDANGLGLALEDVRTIVSFGAPVLESWATPGRVLNLWKEKQLAIVQVEPELSKTAALADVWIPEDASSVARAFTGGPCSARIELALRLVRERGPMLAISGGALSDGDEQAIAALNRGTGAIIRRGNPIATRSMQLPDLPDKSLDVLFIDHGPLGGSVAFDALRPKLRPGGILVSLSPYRAGVAALADYVIPAPAFAECLDETVTPWDAVIPSYAVAQALSDSPVGAVHPLSFISRVIGTGSSPESVLRARVGALWVEKRGEVFNPAARTKQKINEFKSSDELWKAFLGGGCWTDEQAKTSAVVDQSASIVQRRSAVTRSRRPAIKPPLFTKLEQESRIGRV